MKNKKLLLITLLIFLLSIAFSGCKQSNKTISFPITVVGSIFGGQNDDRIKLDLNYNPDWITKNDNTIYNKELAKFSAILCANEYFRAKDVEKNIYNRVECDNSKIEYNECLLLEELGFSDVKKIETYKYKEYLYNTDDSATFTIGYQNVNNLYDTFVVSFRGCYSIGERNSTIDIGIADNIYYQISNEHNEWENKNVFKGFDIAKNRSLEIINEYIEEHDRKNIPNTILLTGHSRGASIADLIGAEYENDNTIKSYTYTFFAPKYSFNNDNKNYKTIFNIINENDFYSYYINFENENLYRYGQDIIYNINSNAEIKKEISNLTNRNDYICINEDDKNNYKKIFAEKFPNRKSLYEISTYKWVFSSEEEAKAKYDFCNEIIGKEKGLDIGNYCKLYYVNINEIGKYEVKLDYYNIVILNCILKTTVYGEKIYNAMSDLFTDNEIGCKLAKIVSDNLLNINTSHLIINAYAISNYSK